MPKMLDVKELLKRADEIKKRHEQTVTLEIKGLGACKFKVPSKSLIDDARTYDNGAAVDEFTVAECMIAPKLNDPELLTAYGVSNSIDLVNKIFLAGEVARVATILIEKAGYTEALVKEIDDLKNE